VDVAKKQIAAAGDKATREAIAVMLNVDTNDIAEILAAPASANFQYEDDQSSPVSRVLAGWFTDSRSSGPYGVLVDVPFEASARPPAGARLLSLSWLSNIAPVLRQRSYSTSRLERDA